MWLRVCSSDQGRRGENNDYVETATFSWGRKRFTAIVACDGVGSRPGSGECARAVGRAALDAVEQYLRERRSSRALNTDDLEQIKSRVACLEVPEMNSDAATTFALAILDHVQSRSGTNVLFLWAGDTRIFFIDITGAAWQLTTDHVDAEGRLLGYFGPDGCVYGTLGSGHCTFPRQLLALFAATDGVYRRCRCSELKWFLLYIVHQRIQKSGDLSREITSFLQKNITDNYSLAVVYRCTSPRQLGRIAESWKEDDDGVVAARDEGF